MSRVRLIAGVWGGQYLESPRGADLRPTSERLRESLFSSLAPELAGARFADLFAGTGAVGLEALSRGAALAALVERNPRCVQAIRASVAKLGAQQAWVVAGAVERVWARVAAEHGPFDVVFVDPPYSYREWRRLLERLLAPGGGLHAEGLLVAQHPRAQPLEAPGEPFRIRDFGESRLSWFRPAAEQEGAG